MDVRRLDPTDSNSQVRYEFYPTSATRHYRHLIIAIVLTTLHLTPIVITDPEDHNAILFAQPYTTKWLMLPYAVYSTIRSAVMLHMGWTIAKALARHGPTGVLIIEPRNVIRNLRVIQLTYLLSGSVLMWDVPYLWATYVLPALWNSLPPYKVEDWEIELRYASVALGLTASLLLGPVLVVALIVKLGWWLGKEARQAERSCWEEIELKKRA